MNYEIEIRRYTEGEDDGYHATFDDVREAYRYVVMQIQHGPFRAWVNNKEVKGAYHGVTIEQFLHAIDPVWAAIADRFGEAFVPRVPTNPATYEKGAL